MPAVRSDKTGSRQRDLKVDVVVGVCKFCDWHYALPEPPRVGDKARKEVVGELGEHLRESHADVQPAEQARGLADVRRMSLSTYRTWKSRRQQK